ncbi:hypothetical protein [Salisediminibacterium beveridgei]|nr:hypothetical protein [Salisediminibacterium beveridgei]
MENLEFRGIPQKDIIDYLKELGGVIQKTSDDHILFQHDEWHAEVFPETFFTFMHSEIPIVKVNLEGIDESTHQETLRKLRLKTFRAGG